MKPMIQKLICCIGLMPALCSGGSAIKSGSQAWNQDWLFSRGDAGLVTSDSGWEKVSLPHPARIEEPMAAATHYQGVCWYRKHFDIDPAWVGNRVRVRFDGAMQVAEVRLNGSLLTVHKGGYLPFVVDLTPALKPRGNVLAVRLDNRDMPTVPPGKPLDSLDFTYQGGLYRNVTLLVAEPVHIADEFEDDQAGGGIFVRTDSASDGKATVFTQVTVRNDMADEMLAAVRFTILDPGGDVIASTLMDETLLFGSRSRDFEQVFQIVSPRLWHPDHPVLYTLRTELLRDGQVREARNTRFGIRTLAYDDKKGFVLNGQPLRLRGANRHQDFPWLGNAVPDNAQYRDLKRLKEAGFNFLRLAHYPQSTAVMDSCDELGIMVSVCTPGWQFWNNSPEFMDLARRDIREMVRWHRNHPSAIMWEVSLNETYGRDGFYAECCRIARDEYHGGQLFTCGDSYASKDVRHYDVPFCGWAGWYRRPAAPGFEGRKRSFIREYGDYECGGEHSTTRIAIGDGEDKQLLQCWNFLWTHNRNLGWDWHIGDCIWVGVDHFRGCSKANPISRCGVLDYLRRPKFSYYLFQSQRDASHPSIFIANYWQPRLTPAKVVVFSNCDEVELVLNGKTIARKKPDAGPDSEYGVWKPEADPMYMTKGKTVLEDEVASLESSRKPRDKRMLSMFDGGNCRNVEHPPFTFGPVPYTAGKLKAIGYVKGRKVCECVRRTPGDPFRLRLREETMGRDLAADGADAIFVRAEAVDAHDEVVPTATMPVSFTVEGEGRIISPATVKAEAGVATMLLQAGRRPGKIRITAAAKDLRSDGITIRTK